MSNCFNNNEDQEKQEDDEEKDFKKKMSALYHEDGDKPPDKLMSSKYFNKDIPEFLQLKIKTFTSDSVGSVSSRCV